MDRNLSSKILYIGIDYRNPIGGVASVEHEYAKFLSPFKFIRTCVNGSKAQKALVAAEGLARFTLRMITDREIEIIHVNASTEASFWRKRMFIRIGRLFGKKIIYHNHGGRFKKFYADYPVQVRKVLDQVDCIVALSDDWKRYFRDELGCPRVEVIPNLVSRPEPPCIPTERASGEPLRLTFLGKIMKEKGIYDLLELLDEQRARYDGKVKLTVGGNGETELFEKMVAEKDLGSMVEFAGWVNGEEKDRLLRATDVFILPSYYEGVPISILEAMSYGKPVVSTRVGGIPEIVTDGENGFLTSPGDKAAIAGAIDRLTDDPALCRHMGEKALEKVKSYFPEEIDRSLSRLYRSLLTP